MTNAILSNNITSAWATLAAKFSRCIWNAFFIWLSATFSSCFFTYKWTKVFDFSCHDQCNAGKKEKRKQYFPIHCLLCLNFLYLCLNVRKRMTRRHNLSFYLGLVKFLFSLYTSRGAFVFLWGHWSTATSLGGGYSYVFNSALPNVFP